MRRKLEMLTKKGLAERYRLSWGTRKQEKRLGAGSQGSVSMVCRLDTGAMGARKRVRSGEDQQYVLKEVALLRKVAESGHPNVVQPWSIVWHTEEQNTVDSFIFEMCDETLHDRYVRQYGIVEPVMIVSLVRDLVCGLAHLHSLGFAHRDVKMDNAMLHVGADMRLHLKLADFGWCKEM